MIEPHSASTASPVPPPPPGGDDTALDQVFFALSDPVRRAILARLSSGTFLVSELAEPFDISIQAVSRHIQVLVRAGLVRQERTGRISRCRLEVAPIYSAAVWINQYSAFWEARFDALVDWLGKAEAGKSAAGASRKSAKQAPSAPSKTGGMP